MGWATLLKLLGVVGVGYLTLITLAWYFQTWIAFPAPDAPLPEPAEHGFADGERVEIVTADEVTLRGWFLPARPEPQGPAPALLWLHGNLETVVELAPVLRAFRPPGVSVLVIDYRGYGQSSGRPTEAGVYRDAEGAYRWLRQREDVHPDRIAVYGKSIGSAPALHLARHSPLWALILDSPFTNARELAREHYAWVPIRLLRLELDNLARARSLATPALVVHGSSDRIVPLRMGRAIAEALGDAELYVVEGAGHNNLYEIGGHRYAQRMHAFLQRALEEPSVARTTPADE